MSDFSIAQAAGAGIGVVRRRPATLIIWYLVSILIGSLGIFLAGRMLAPALADLQAAQASGGPPDPQVALAAASRMIGGLFMLIPFYLVLGAITTTAANRAVLHPDDGRYGYYRLGPDELRMIVVLLVIGLILFATYFVGAIAAVVIAMAAGGKGAAANPQAMAGTMSVAILPVLILMGLVAVKFCAAPAQTLDTRSINIFGSWSVTKGKFWPIVGVYAINAIGFGLIYVVLVYLSFYAAAAANGQTMAQAMRPDPAIAFNIANPGTIARVLIGGVIAVLGQVLLVCPGASIYMQLTERGEEAESF